MSESETFSHSFMENKPIRRSLRQRGFGESPMKLFRFVSGYQCLAEEKDNGDGTLTLSGCLWPNDGGYTKHLMMVSDNITVFKTAIEWFGDVLPYIEFQYRAIWEAAVDGKTPMPEADKKLLVSQQRVL